MKKLLFISVLILLLVGCEQVTSIKYSNIKEETAEVIAMSYTPNMQTTNVSPGIDSSGDFVVSINSQRFPEIWAVTLRCSEHKATFAFQSKELFNKVKIGDTVVLRYVDKIEYHPYDNKNEYIESIVGQHTTQIIFKDSTSLDR